MRRATASMGGPRRPALEIVQPSAVRETVTCSLPTGTPRTKIVRLAAPVSRAGEGCADAGVGTANANTAAAARIEWDGSIRQHSIMIPAASSTAYEAARHRAALVDRSDRGRLVVSGTDRASYLQGLLTNDIAALRSGQGCYAAYLTAQGRMITDLWAYELGDVILLNMNGEVKDSVLARLDQFVFSEDVQLGDVTAAFAQIAVVGPQAASR